MERERLGIEDVKRHLKEIWSELFLVPSVADNANFFSLGGDSVTATILMIHIDEVFNIQLDDIEIFERPVLEDFAEALHGALGQSLDEPMSEITL